MKNVVVLIFIEKDLKINYKSNLFNKKTHIQVSLVIIFKTIIVTVQEIF